MLCGWVSFALWFSLPLLYSSFTGPKGPVGDFPDPRLFCFQAPEEVFPPGFSSG